MIMVQHERYEFRYIVDQCVTDVLRDVYDSHAHTTASFLLYYVLHCLFHQECFKFKFALQKQPFSLS